MTRGMGQRDFNQGRSAVYAENGAAATAHPAASLVALDVLRAGGNAVDAAIAAVALLCVIEPQATGIGGDCFVLFSIKGGPPIGLNGSGRSPAKATIDTFRAQGIREISVESPQAVTIPGAVDAWCRLLADYGTKSIDELLQPAIRAATEGYVVAPRVAADWSRMRDKLARDRYASARYLPQSRSPAAGERMVFPELAETLKRIGKQGRDGFYRGYVAEDLVERLGALGGTHTLDDFEKDAPDYVTALTSPYRGYDVSEIPPNGQGITAQIMLNVLSGYDFGSESYSEADRIHLLAEVSKAAYARRDALLGDPDFADIPVAQLLSGDEAAAIRAKINIDTASTPELSRRIEHTDTTYLTVVDRDLNAVSFINSLFAGFGTGILGPRSGVLLQNRGSSFRMIDGHPNMIAPRKRPMHTIIPGMLCRDQKPVLSFGVMGGHFQPVGHSILVTGMLDRGLDPQEAISAPRSFAYDGELRLEPTISQEVAADLHGRGHRVVRTAEPLGGGQAIWIDDERGVLVAGSDPRKDGCALGY